MGKLKKQKATYSYKEVRSILLELRRGKWPKGMINPDTEHASSDVLYFTNVINAFGRKGVMLDPYRTSDPA